MLVRAASSVLNAVVLLFFVFPRSVLADSQSFQGTVQPGQSLNFTVTTDALGPLNYTLAWSNGAPLESCIYAPGSGDPDACGSSPSPQPVADSPTVTGTFTVCVFLAMGYPQTDFTLVVNYPTTTTDAFVGNEVRDDPSSPPMLISSARSYCPKNFKGNKTRFFLGRVFTSESSRRCVLKVPCFG